MLRHTLLVVFILSSCSSFKRGDGFSDRYSKRKKPDTFFKKHKKEKTLKGPCVNLPFVDRNYPRLLNESIRLYQPKVGIKSAFKITKQLLKDENKIESYTLDSKSGKLCKVKGEFGYSFKAIRVND